MTAMEKIFKEKTLIIIRSLLHAVCKCYLWMEQWRMMHNLCVFFCAHVYSKVSLDFTYKGQIQRENSQHFEIEIAEHQTECDALPSARPCTPAQLTHSWSWSCKWGHGRLCLSLSHFSLLELLVITELTDSEWKKGWFFKTRGEWTLGRQIQQLFTVGIEDQRELAVVSFIHKIQKDCPAQG